MWININDLTASELLYYRNRERELNQFSKSVLVGMHVANGGYMGRAHYMRWTKDEIIGAVLMDESYMPDGWKNRANS